MYYWDINQWAENEVPVEVRKPAMVKWMQALLKPLKDLHAVYESYRIGTLKRMRYNGQTIVLENLINDLYDPVQRRFEIDTIYDELAPVYIYAKSENSAINNQQIYLHTTQAYINDTQQLLKKVYLNRHEELGRLYDFVVKTPDSFTSPTAIIKLKATVNYYRLAGKRPHYEYIVSHQSF